MEDCVYFSVKGDDAKSEVDYYLGSGYSVGFDIEDCVYFDDQGVDINKSEVGITTSEVVTL